MVARHLVADGDLAVREAASPLESRVTTSQRSREPAGREESPTYAAPWMVVRLEKSWRVRVTKLQLGLARVFLAGEVMAKQRLEPY